MNVKEEVMRTLREFLKDESGQDLVEYALLASLVAIASIAALKVLGAKVSSLYGTVEASL